MITQHQILATTALAAGEPTASPSGRIATWAEVCADYYAAAAMYEQLSVLSDAELTRRGLSRATLARDTCVACDRCSQP